MDLINFICGSIFGSIFLEPIIINYIYFGNIALFNDLILTKRNRKRLKEYYNENI